MDLKYFINAATFVQRVKVTSAKAKLVGYVEYCLAPADNVLLLQKQISVLI